MSDKIVRFTHTEAEIKELLIRAFKTGFLMCNNSLIEENGHGFGEHEATLRADLTSSSWSQKILITSTRHEIPSDRSR